MKKALLIILTVIASAAGWFSLLLGIVGLEDHEMIGLAIFFILLGVFLIVLPVRVWAKYRKAHPRPAKPKSKSESSCDPKSEGAYDIKSGYYIPAGNTVKPGSTSPAPVPPQEITRPAPAKPLLKGKFDIIDGLPLPTGTRCLVSVYADVLAIEALGQRFTLNQRRIFNVSVSTVKQLQKQYVSSVGGAIAGGLLLGPLGAIIGGSAKQKNVKSFDRFLIFAYTDDSGAGAKHLVFAVRDGFGDKSSEFVRLFKPRSKQVQVTTNL